jgi:hypothetical protein
MEYQARKEYKGDITIPVIYATLNYDGKHPTGALIDGIHRVNRRNDCNCTEFPVVVLNLTESAYVAIEESDPRSFKSAFGITKAEALRRAKAEGLV